MDEFTVMKSLITVKPFSALCFLSINLVFLEATIPPLCVSLCSDYLLCPDLYHLRFMISPSLVYWSSLLCHFVTM